MYSLTFCVHFLLPERHQWKPAVQTAAVMLRTPPSAAGRRRADRTRFPYAARGFGGAPRRPPVAGHAKCNELWHFCTLLMMLTKIVDMN